MNGILIGAMMAVSMVQQTDTTFAVDNAEALHVETLGGSIEVDVWDRDDVRIQAEHSSRTYIDIGWSRNHIDVEPEARRGPANLVDFKITVPRTLALELESNQGDISVVGADGRLKIETVQGEIYILGGRGTIEVSNTAGSILVEDADGRIDIESSGADVRVVDSGGEIFAETAGGSVILENIRATAVDVGSTGGRVHFDGTLDPAGTYFFGAHGGSITIVVPEDARASFNVATIHGSISSNLTGENLGFKGGERHTFDVGGGGALVEAETYGGRIRLMRRGSDGSRAPERRAPLDADLAWVDGAGLAPSSVAEWAIEFGTRLGSELSAGVADELSSEWAFERAAELGTEVSTELSAQLASELGAAWAPRVSARVSPAVTAAWAPAVSARVSRAVEAALAPMGVIGFEPAAVASEAPVPTPRIIRR